MCKMDNTTETAYLGLFQRINSRLSSLGFMVRLRETEKDFTRNRCLTFIILRAGTNCAYLLKRKTAVYSRSQYTTAGSAT